MLLALQAGNTKRLRVGAAPVASTFVSNSTPTAFARSGYGPQSQPIAYPVLPLASQGQSLLLPFWGAISALPPAVLLQPIASSSLPVPSGGVEIIPDALALSIIGYAPTVSIPVTITPAPLSLTLTGYAPTVSRPVTVTPGVLSLQLTGYAPTVSTPRTAIPGALVLHLAGYAPTVRITPPGVTVVPATLVLHLAGYAPTVSTPRTIIPQTLTLSLTGYIPAVATPAYEKYLVTGVSLVNDVYLISGVDLSSTYLITGVSIANDTYLISGVTL